MQGGSSTDMIFGVPRRIELASAARPPEPGRPILTGSPAGDPAHRGRTPAPGAPGFGTPRTPCVAAP